SRADTRRAATSAASAATVVRRKSTAPTVANRPTSPSGPGMRAGAGALRSLVGRRPPHGPARRARPGIRSPLPHPHAPMPDIEITLDATLFATAFVTVLVVMDPVGNVPVFLSLTRDQPPAQQRRAALLA